MRAQKIPKSRIRGDININSHSWCFWIFSILVLLILDSGNVYAQKEHNVDIKDSQKTISDTSISEKNNDVNIEHTTCDSISRACLVSFPLDHEENYIVEGASTWFYIYVAQEGTIVFEVINDKDDADDIDLYVYNSNGDLLGHSTNNGNANEKVEIEKTTATSEKFYIETRAYDIVGLYATATVKAYMRQCSSYTNYYCSGDVLRKEGRNPDCSTFDTYIDTCDGTRTDWQYYCKGDSEVYRKKIITSEYCSNGYSSCKESSSIQDYYFETCDSDEKCSNGACVKKTCSDYPDTVGSCIALGNTYCNGGSTGHPYECKDLGPVWCYQKIDTCTSDEYCEDPSGPEGARCFPYPCTISSVSWDKTSALIGENVGITVQGSHCKSSDLVTFEVYEDDAGFKDEKGTSPASKYFSSNPVKTNWTAEYFKDIMGDPEFAIYAYHNGNEYKSSNLLTVSCPNNDGDSYSSYGGVCGLVDCNDNNRNIYPGATEVCNSQDDDCDGQKDEDFNLQTDENNCGRCGNVCERGYVCSSGICKGCGDGICSIELGENPTTCPNDCYGDLRISQIISAPSSVRQGQQVRVQVKIENKGTYVKTLSVEAGIIPDSWEGKAFTAGTQSYSVQSAIPVQSCCSANNYYVAKNITLNPGQSEYVTFNLYAPTPSSIDACNGLGSAWSDKTHKLIVGLYEKCGSGYIDSKVQNLKVYKICTDQVDCPGEYCDFNTGYPGICKPKTCQDACGINGIYLCSGNEISQCVDINGDGCLDLKHVDYCSASSSCVPGRSTCQPSPRTKVQIEYANLNTRVNKQPGDIVKLRLKYGGTETITLLYNNSLLNSINCPDSFTITSDKECLFEVRDAAGDKTDTNIGIINGQQGKLRILINPSTIIVTDRKKLLEIYSDENEVDALLAEAYNAAFKEEGIIYNLEDYFDNHLWTNPSEYEGGRYAIR